MRTASHLHRHPADADLLFSVRMGGRGTLLYLLFEHQSSPDPAMPLRLPGYVMGLMNRCNCL